MDGPLQLAPEELRNSLTRVLGDVARGQDGAETQLLELIHGELRRLAVAKMRSQPPDHTLQVTALVNEAYLRLFGNRTPAFQDRAHFLSAAAAAMRSILVDHARKQQAQKRGGGIPAITLREDLDGGPDLSQRVQDVHDALELLSETDERKARVVELLFFAGLDMEEAARVMGISERTVRRDWSYARVWLYRKIQE